VCVYATFPSDTDHRYRYAKWNGTSWDDHQICTAGRYLYVDQPHYSGGVTIDRDDVNTVYASRGINGIHNIYREVTSDGGATWTESQMTEESRAIRPYVVSGAAEPRLLYMTGNYASYTDYDTTLKLIDSTGSITPATDGNRANVLLHVRAQSTSDISPVARTLTFGSSVSFAGNEIVLPGSTNSSGSGVITAPDAADLTFAGDFTIEIFGAKIATPTAQNELVSQWRTATASRSWQVAYQGNLTPDTIGIYLSSDGTTNQFNEGTFTPVANAAHDLCFERSGNTVRVYVDGSMLASETYSSTLKNSPARLIIGGIEASTGVVDPAGGGWNGRFKELRITKAARYANDSGYTVPSLPLPTA
jgi:hypothetical protein